MQYSITLYYFHPLLKIALSSVKEAWLLTDINNPIRLKPVIYQGNLFFRIPVSGKRISYRTLKIGLIKKKIIIKQPLKLLPF